MAEVKTLLEELEQRTTLMTAKEVAALMHVTVDTVYRYATAKYIPSVRCGDLVRFVPQVIADFLVEDATEPCCIEEYQLRALKAKVVHDILLEKERPAVDAEIARLTEVVKSRKKT